MGKGLIVFVLLFLLVLGGVGAYFLFKKDKSTVDDVSVGVLPSNVVIVFNVTDRDGNSLNASVMSFADFGNESLYSGSYVFRDGLNSVVIQSNRTYDFIFSSNGYYTIQSIVAPVFKNFTLFKTVMIKADEDLKLDFWRTGMAFNNASQESEYFFVLNVSTNLSWRRGIVCDRWSIGVIRVSFVNLTQRMIPASLKGVYDNCFNLAETLHSTDGNRIGFELPFEVKVMKGGFLNSDYLMIGVFDSDFSWSPKDRTTNSPLQDVVNYAGIFVGGEDKNVSLNVSDFI